MASSGGPWRPLPGFNYSAALKAKGGTWTVDNLNPWLTDPRADVPGTLMSFGGIGNEKQRADIVAYLNSLSDNPQPLPAAQKAGSPAAAANPPAPAAAQWRGFRAEGEIAFAPAFLSPRPHADVKCISSRAERARWRRN